MNSRTNSFISVLVIIMTLVGFVMAMTAGEYRIALASVAGGFFLWITFLSVVKMRNSALPVVVTISGLMIGISLFMDSAVQQTMWGDYQIQPDAALFSLVFLLLAMTPGLLLFYFRGTNKAQPSAPFSVAKPAQAAPVSAATQPVTVQENPYDTWNPEEFEVEYDPELIAAYYESYEAAEEE